MNKLSDLKGTTALLNGQEGLHDTEAEFKSALDRLGKSVLVLDNLFEQSEKLLQVTQCDNLAFSTTGLYAEQLKTLVEVFEKLQYVPKNVFFLTDQTALTFSGVARDFKEKGTKFYFLDFLDLMLKKQDVGVEEVSWL